jgi:hypothetical protein
MGMMTNVYRILVGKHEGKRPLGRPKHRCEANIRVYLRDNRVGMCGLDTMTNDELDRRTEET